MVLASGEALWENQSRISFDGQYRLQYQGDGNLVVARLADESCAWSSQTNGTSVWVAVMQGDGNLVVYDADGVPVWNSGTAGYDGSRLEIANHTMAIVGPDGTTRWAVSLAAAPAADSTVGGLAPGAGHRAGALLACVIGLLGLAVMGLRRRLPAPEPQRTRRTVAHLPATALLLAAMLLVPATALAQIPTQQVEYYHTDALGSVRAVTKQVNGTWQVVARHDYMPFGEEVAPPSPPPDKRLFTGKERDNETGLDYFGARYLRADLGRFTTIDPVYTWTENLVDPQRWNRYSYVRNNPLKYTDPDGRELITADLARLQEIAGSAGQKLSLSNGKLDVSGLTPLDLKANEGAALLYQLATSPSVYTYDEGSVARTLGGTTPVQGAVSNLNDRSDIRYAHRPGGRKDPIELPPAGINAAVVINPAVQMFEQATGRPVSTRALAFHELAEVYATVDGGQQYLPLASGSHATAVARERLLVSQRPGFTQGLAGALLRR